MRIAPSPPPVCTGCGLAKPHDTFVDFEANFDGPAFQVEGVRGFVSELLLCEACVTSAASTLALRVEPVRDLEIERDQALAKAKAWKDYAEGLEASQARRPEPVRRGPGRPPRTAPRPEAVAA